MPTHDAATGTWLDATPACGAPVWAEASGACQEPRGTRDDGVGSSGRACNWYGLWKATGAGTGAGAAPPAGPPPVLVAAPAATNGAGAAATPAGRYNCCGPDPTGGAPCGAGTGGPDGAEYPGYTVVGLGKSVEQRSGTVSIAKGRRQAERERERVRETHTFTAASVTPPSQVVVVSGRRPNSDCHSGGERRRRVVVFLLGGCKVSE